MATCGVWQESVALRGRTWKLLVQDGGEGGQQVLQQLFQAPPQQPRRIAVRLRLNHNLQVHKEIQQRGDCTAVAGVKSSARPRLSSHGALLYPSASTTICQAQGQVQQKPARRLQHSSSRPSSAVPAHCCTPPPRPQSVKTKISFSQELVGRLHCSCRCRI